MLSKKVKILIFGSLIGTLGMGMLGPLFAVFAERIGGDILDISWAWATYLFVTGLLTIIIGKVSDVKYRKETLVVIGFALSALFTFSYLLVKSPTHLLLVQIGMGISTAILTPTWDALYSLHGNKTQQGFEWGIVSGGGDLALAVGIILGGLVVTFLSFNFLFIIMGIIQVIAALVLLGLLWDKN